MPDWKTRLAVSYVDDAGNEELISPIDSFVPSFSLATEVLHSIEKTHIGVIYSPQSVSFSMSVKAIGDIAAKLTDLALNGKRFRLVLQETDEGSDWAFKKLVMSDCLITSATPTSASPSGAPTATFSGICLGASAEGKSGAIARVP